MDIFKMMQTGEGIEHLEEHLLNLDSEFRFKCRRCGKCCIHQETIIFNARDIYNIAKKKGMTVQEVVNAYTEAYIGRNSHIPIVHLLSNGPKGACPLLENGRCSVHDCKPTVCALFPLGRVIIGEKFGEPIEDPDNLQVKYILNEHMADFCRKNGISDGSCGMRSLIDWIMSTEITGDPHISAMYTIISKATADEEDRAAIVTSVLEPIFAPKRKKAV